MNNPAANAILRREEYSKAAIITRLLIFLFNLLLCRFNGTSSAESSGVLVMSASQSTTGTAKERNLAND